MPSVSNHVQFLQNKHTHACIQKISTYSAVKVPFMAEGTASFLSSDACAFSYGAGIHLERQGTEI